MLKQIPVFDAEGQEASMVLMATARTPRRYKQLFGRDLYADFESITEGETDEDERTAVVERLAFVMHCQAAGADFKAVSANAEDAMADWLDTLDSTAITGNALEIVSVYLENRRMGSETKNALAQLSGK